jgi:hypothetical protein
MTSCNGEVGTLIEEEDDYPNDKKDTYVYQEFGRRCKRMRFMGLASTGALGLRHEEHRVRRLNPCGSDSIGLDTAATTEEICPVGVDAPQIIPINVIHPQRLNRRPKIKSLVIVDHLKARGGRRQPPAGSLDDRLT